MNGKERLVGSFGQWGFAFVSPVKWDAGMAFIWKLNDIIAFLFVFPYLNKANCFSEEWVVGADDPYCSKI